MVATITKTTLVSRPALNPIRFILILLVWLFINAIVFPTSSKYTQAVIQTINRFLSVYNYIFPLR